MEEVVRERSMKVSGVCVCVPAYLCVECVRWCVGGGGCVHADGNMEAV